MLTTKTWATSSSAAEYYLSSEMIDQVGPAIWTGKTKKFLKDWPNVVDSETLMHLLDPPFAGNLRSNRKPAIDLAFTAPKPVSIFAALVDEEKRTDVIQAHLNAVGKALEKIESEQAMVKLSGAKANEIIRATDGRNRPIRISGNKGSGKRKNADDGKDVEKEQVYLRSHNLIAAQFTHFCSRPVDGEPDPNLHTHCLIPRITQRGDGEWVTLYLPLDSTSPNVNRPYNDTLLDGLRRMGVDARQCDSYGIAIEGISGELVDAFSQRSQKIGAICDAMEPSADHPPTPTARRLAALISREPKGTIPWQDRLSGWRRRAIACVAPEPIEALQSQLKDDQVHKIWDQLWECLEKNNNGRSQEKAPKQGVFPQR
jgi:TrwC relaxase.